MATSHAVFIVQKFADEKLFVSFEASGGLAQLARAFAWHARGHRFDSDILHIENTSFAKFRKAFFVSDKTLIKLKVKNKEVTKTKDTMNVFSVNAAFRALYWF